MKRLTILLLGIITPHTAAAISIQKYFPCDRLVFLCTTGDPIAQLTRNITSFVLTSITAVATVAFMYGAFRMIISSGGEGKETGKKAMQYAMFGLILAYLAVPILLYVIGLIQAIA